MRIGVISDTHIPERADAIPAKALKEFKGVDMVIHCGDLVTGHVLEALQAVCGDVRAVHGNMDPQELKRSLPEKLVIKVGKYSIGVAHGYGPPKQLIKAMQQLFDSQHVDLVIFGHSHQAQSSTVGGVIYFNPGSATDTVFAPYKSFGIIEIGDTIMTQIVKL
jgi:putative phosphoesterase